MMVSQDRHWVYVTFLPCEDEYFDYLDKDKGKVTDKAGNSASGHGKRRAELVESSPKGRDRTKQQEEKRYSEQTPDL